jgi:hypothetical protein
LYFSANNWAIKIRLVESFLNAPAASASAFAGFEVRAFAARLRNGSRLFEGWRLYDSATNREQV